MNKTDAALKHDVEAELAWDPAVPAPSVSVAVRHGVVTASGHLRTYAETHAVERAVRRVAGVKAIVLALDVRLPPEHRRGDTDIALSAEQALLWNADVPERIHVGVQRGWVTLQGQVEWDYQRRSVQESVRNLMGVVGVTNEVTVKPRRRPVDLQGRIAAALGRQAQATACAPPGAKAHERRPLAIEVDGATVILRGTVHSWHERDAAQAVAWSAPGVRSVINELRVE